MNTASEVIREEIARSGPMPFRRFMEIALYHPVHGYYTRGRDPFGKAGDFYTAEQLQPVFGILIASAMRLLKAERGRDSFEVVELGAGRGEMRPFLEEFGYAAVEAKRGSLPDSVDGVIFANEFFDALPVDLCVYRDGCWRMREVTWDGERFEWIDGAAAGDAVLEYLKRYGPLTPEEGMEAEAALSALEWIERIAGRLRGFLFLIDYGYTRRELVRFPRGTLMSYRRHRAEDDVLAHPGDRDITAHVNFTALEQHALRHGFTRVHFEPMSATLLRAGEVDEFRQALGDGGAAERTRRSLQLKSLLFGLGETFRTLLLRRDGEEGEA